MRQSVRLSVCLSVCLCHSTSSTTVHFRVPTLEVEPTGQRGSYRNGNEAVNVRSIR